MARGAIAKRSSPLKDEKPDRAESDPKANAADGEARALAVLSKPVVNGEAGRGKNSNTKK